MNNTHKKREQNTRKVILIKYKDSTENIILTETVKKHRQSLKITIQCESLQADEVNIRSEKRPVFRRTDSIVPCCLRDKCRRAIQFKSNQCRLNRKRKPKHESKSQGKTERKRDPSIISISDEEGPIQYDEVSSGTLSSYDSEIDTLLQSTRKRMRSSNEEWSFLPCKKKRKNSFINIDSSRSIKSASLNSLDTLVLDTMEDNGYTTQKVIKLESLETNHTVHKVMPTSTYELVQCSNIKREEHFEQNADTKCDSKKSLDTPVLDTVEDNVYTTQKVIKLESLETNHTGHKVMPTSTYELVQSSNIKREEHFEQNADTKCDSKMIKLEPPEADITFYNESNQYLLGNENLQTYVNKTNGLNNAYSNAEWQNNAYPNNIIVVNNIIKAEPLLESNGDVIKNYETSIVRTESSVKQELHYDNNICIQLFK